MQNLLKNQGQYGPERFLEIMAMRGGLAFRMLKESNTSEKDIVDEAEGMGREKTVENINQWLKDSGSKDQVTFREYAQFGFGGK